MCPWELIDIYTYVRTNVRTYVHTYVRTYLSTYNFDVKRRILVFVTIIGSLLTRRAKVVQEQEEPQDDNEPMVKAMTSVK